MLRRKWPRVANETVDNKAIARALFENEETKALEEEAANDEAIAKMAQEEVLTEAVMSLPGFTDEARRAAISWLAKHEIHQWRFLQRGVMARR